jgi:limonene-1,2-epoxide hydrolase
MGARTATLLEGLVTASSCPKVRYRDGVDDGRHREETMPSAEQVVREFCAAASTRDPAVLRSFFSDDIVYHNIPMDPAVGIEATMAVIDMFVGMCDALEFDVHHLASDGTTVLTERTDRFTLNGRTAPLPVMGAFRVENGKIAEWRDYFDMAQVTALFAE